MDNQLIKIGETYLHHLNNDTNALMNYLKSEDKDKSFGQIYGKVKNKVPNNIGYEHNKELFQNIVYELIKKMY